MPSDAFADRARSYEDGYFAQKDADVVAKLRGVFESKRTTEELSKTSGITNPEVLDRLLKLSLSGEMMTVFRLYPLVEIAWADGSFDKAESKAVLDAAVKHGASETGLSIKRLEEWLQKGPTPDARAAWRMFAAELCNVLTPDQLTAFRNDLLRDAKLVAEASGGVLGLFMTTSSGEHKVIEEITKALTK